MGVVQQGIVYLSPRKDRIDKRRTVQVAEVQTRIVQPCAYERCLQHIAVFQPCVSQVGMIKTAHF